MSVVANIVAKIEVTETLESLVEGIQRPVFTHNKFKVAGRQYDATSTVTATDVSNGMRTLSAGSLTIDMTALPGTQGASAVDATGKKLRAIYFENADEAGEANDNAVTIEAGVSNGYLLFGTAGKITIDPGAGILFWTPSAPTVSGSAKNITLTGTGTQSFRCLLLIG